MNKLTRRNFLKNSVLAGAALSMPARSWAKVAGANDDIRIAVVGFNGRGQAHIAEFTTIPGVRIVALCDVDYKVLDAGVAKLKTKGLVHRHPQAAGEKRSRRDLDCDAESLARARRDLGHAGGQGCLR